MQLSKRPAVYRYRLIALFLCAAPLEWAVFV